VVALRLGSPQLIHPATRPSMPHNGMNSRSYLRYHPECDFSANAMHRITQTSWPQHQPSPWRFVLQVNIRKPVIDKLFAKNAPGY
jgi:hypothetical protein